MTDEKSVKQTNKNGFKETLKRIKWGKIILVTAVLSIIIVGSLGGYFAYSVYKETADFNAEKLKSGEPSKLFDETGQLITTLNSDKDGKRQNVAYDDLPQVLVDAVISAEDSRFFEHDGFDLPRILKSAMTSLAAGHITGGGSTITQQVIKKSYYPKEEQTLERKLGEVFLAMEATKEISKEEILTLYLNKIYFGRGTDSIGIAAASKYYFDKDVKDLTLPEAALLAGTLNSPNSLDPYYNLDRATARRDTILSLMVTHGYISQEECDAAQKILVQNMLKENPENSNDGPSQAYIDLVVAEVIKKTGKDPRVTQMNIYTYLKPDVQEYAYGVVTGEKYTYREDTLEMSGSIQSTLDGRIVAVMGGRNYKAGDLNLATVKQQPGSSLKPILDYGMAYKYLDWCTQHTVEDKPFTEQPGWDPTNWDGSQGKHGKMTVAIALANSWNLPAIWTYYEVLKKATPQEIHDILQNMGIDMKKDPVENFGFYGYSIGGWDGGTSPIELGSAYSTVANNGKATEAHTINYIEYPNGEKVEVDQECQTNAKQALDASVSFMIRETQAEYVKINNESYGRINGIPQTVAKTGTSTYKGSPYVRDGAAKDIWFTTYNPDYTVSVWMGRSQAGIKLGKHMDNYMLESSKPASMIMKYLNKGGLKNTYPERPSDVVSAAIVKGLYINGHYVSPSANTPATMIVNAWFKKGTTPNAKMEDLAPNALTSFNASLTSDGHLSVEFSPYDPLNATTNEKATAGTQIYGKVVYAVDVSDASSGEALYTGAININSGVLPYQVPSGKKVNVKGYYTYENSNNLRSNEIAKTLGKDLAITNISSTITDINGSVIANGGTIVGDEINVLVTPQSNDSVIVVSLFSDSGTPFGDPIPLNKGAPSCKITKLSLDSGYTIKITETIGDKSAPVTTFKFTTAP